MKVLQGNARDISGTIATTDAPPDTATQVQNILRQSWFGIAPEESVTGAATGDLIVSGISQSDRAALAGAFIAQAGKPEVFYRIGDAVAGGNGTLRTVFTNYVILSNGGVQRRLNLRSTAATATISAASTTATVATPGSGDASPFVLLPGAPQAATPSLTPAEMARRFVADPDTLLAGAGLVPVDKSGKKGYRFSGGDSQRLFTGTTISTGDIILAVNGKPVGNPKSDRLLAPALVGEKTLVLDVLRGGKRITVNYPDS